MRERKKGVDEVARLVGAEKRRWGRLDGYWLAVTISMKQAKMSKIKSATHNMVPGSATEKLRPTKSKGAASSNLFVPSEPSQHQLLSHHPTTSHASHASHEKQGLVQQHVNDDPVPGFGTRGPCAPLFSPHPRRPTWRTHHPPKWLAYCWAGVDHIFRDPVPRFDVSLEDDVSST